MRSSVTAARPILLPVVAGVGPAAVSGRGVAGDVLSQPQVAVDPSSGRATVLWRGSASRGRNRLQWRITTNGRLGPVHTLGEFGRTPLLGTDASGKTIAVWLGTAGVRTAARRKGEFLRPATIGTAAAQDLRLAVAASGDTVAAWRVPSPGGADVQSPRGVPTAASRTRATGFGAPQAIAGVADAGTLSASVAPNHRAVLAFDRQADDTTATVTAAYRPGRGLPFAGTATVAWAGAGNTVFAARSDATGAFAAPQALGPAAGAIPVRVAAAGSATAVVWADTGGGRIATGG